MGELESRRGDTVGECSVGLDRQTDRVRARIAVRVPVMFNGYNGP